MQKKVFIHLVSHRTAGVGMGQQNLLVR
jgi:hypothetical protein